MSAVNGMPSWRLPAMTASHSPAKVLATEERFSEATMEDISIAQIDDEREVRPDARMAEEQRIHEWRTEKLENLGIPAWLADIVADRIDWHDLAALVARGCPPRLALDIVR